MFNYAQYMPPYWINCYKCTNTVEIHVLRQMDGNWKLFQFFLSFFSLVNISFALYKNDPHAKRTATLLNMYRQALKIKKILQQNINCFCQSLPIPRILIYAR